MKRILVTLTLATFAFTAFSQDARYETVTVAISPSNDNFFGVTNQIVVADYETAELFDTSPITYTTFVYFTKNGSVFREGIVTARANGSVGTTVRGPATFQLVTSGSGFGGSSIAGYMTVKITPVSFPPDKTFIVPPGTNQIQISLESSTNLVNWATATNGVYGSPTEAQFFRLKMTKLN